MVSAGLIITQVLNGLTIGLIYALIALGLTIVLGLMGVVNFAHGSFYMIGGYITFTITSSIFGNFWVGLIMGAFVSAMVGVGLFVSIIKPLRQRPPLEPMVVLVGVAMIFEQLIRSFWGADPKLLPIPFGRIEFDFLGFTFRYPIYFLMVMIISILMLIFFYYLFRKTDLGVRCLASIQDREMAMSLGVDVDRVGRLMFIIGTAAAGIAGGLAGPIFSVYPTMGIELIGLVFVIVIVGGLGSIGGTVIASVTIAMITSLSLIFVSGNIAHIFAYCILLLILLIRPRGIMGFEKVLE
jgi:branched-chain amino acid transport system permease protein